MRKSILIRLRLMVLAITMLVALAPATAAAQNHPPDCQCCCCSTPKQPQGPVADDCQKYPECSYCGMNRQNFAHSRMLIEYSDGSFAGLCSLHCAAIDLTVNLRKTPLAIQVGDYPTKNLIDAEKAVWVIGGKKPGVMTERAKWAFADKQAARAFTKENGGKPANFEQAVKAAYEDIYLTSKKTREKRARQPQPKQPEAKSE